jgi:hypothetical protein
MSEARALLEAALEGTIGVHRRLGVTYADMFAATKEGAELIRRADRPEARVAVVEEPCSETMLCPYPQDHPVHAEDGDHDYLPAPRPPEPDRTLRALRQAAVGFHDFAVGHQPGPRSKDAASRVPFTQCQQSECVEARAVLPEYLPAPRPPEPDRTAALVEVANLLRRHTHNETSVISHRCGNVNDCLLCRALVKAGVLTLDDIGSTTREAILAPTPDEAP